MPRAKRATHEAVPATMQAAAIDRFGGPSVLKLHELPTPTPEPDQVLIAIHTAGVGMWDAKIRDGSWRKPGRPRFPRVPGLDGAGVVVAKGARVRRLAIGDRVWAYVRRLGARVATDARSRDAVDRLDAAAPDGVDVVLAFAGGRELERLLELVPRGGRIVYPNGVEPEPERRAGVRTKSYDAAVGADELAALVRAIERARLRVPIAAQYPLARAADAHRRLKQDHVVGRVVLAVRRVER